MIYSFFVEKFRNLKMSEPVILSKNITFLLGDCGAGKTNFCRALGDIKCVEIKGTWEQPGQFIYCFIEDNVEIIYEYLRTEQGEVVEKILRIPEYEMIYHSKLVSYCPMDIFAEIINLYQDSKVQKLLEKCRRFVIDEMHIYIPEQVFSQESLQYNNAEYVGKKNNDISNKKIVVWDDIELCEKDRIRTLFSWVCREEVQLIVSIRRTEWINMDWGSIDDYVCIKQGTVKTVKGWTDKNIKTIEQLKNLYQKGYFDKMP